MNRAARIAAATALGLTLGGIAVAQATEQADTGATIEKVWVIPEAGNWPQKPYTGVEVGTCQFDVYRYGTPEEIAYVDAMDDDGVLTQGEDTRVLVSYDVAPCPTPEPEPEPTPTPEPEQPSVVAPPVATPPAPAPAPQPVTPATPKDLSALSVDERADVETFAKAHGIAPEAVLVEMG